MDRTGREGYKKRNQNGWTTESDHTDYLLHI